MQGLGRDEGMAIPEAGLSAQEAGLSEIFPPGNVAPRVSPACLERSQRTDLEWDGNNLEWLQFFVPGSEAKIWPWTSEILHTRSRAAA